MIRSTLRTPLFACISLFALIAIRSIVGVSLSSSATAAEGTRAELDALVDRLGRTKPDWYDQTPLDHPQTLDLSWDQPPQGGWNNQKNVGQYLWDVINPNPNRWRSGVRLMHHLLTLHKDDAEKRERILLTLGNMYHNLLEDHGRAAFWYRAAGVEKTPDEYSHSAVVLAECYLRLGYPTEARKLLERTPHNLSQAKLWAELGETDRSLKMALEDEEDSPDFAWMCAGDACRIAGRLDDALAYYRKVLAIPVPPKNPPGRLLKNRNRAEANVAAIRYFERFDPRTIADGVYQSASQGYEGPVEVSVTVRAGKLESVKVVRHREKQFYAALTDTPRKIIAKQSVKGIDATTNATITSEAIINATAKALGERK